MHPAQAQNFHFCQQSSESSQASVLWALTETVCFVEWPAEVYQQCLSARVVEVVAEASKF